MVFLARLFFLKIPFPLLPTDSVLHVLIHDVVEEEDVPGFLSYSQIEQMRPRPFGTPQEISGDVS